MREIKFRVWDSRFKKYINPSDVHICCETGKAKGKQGGNGYVYDWRLEQFTGLKDCSGVDIYEGDIVNVSDGGHWDLAEIESEAVRFEDIGWHPWTMVSSQIDRDYIVSSDSKHIKVIGNIHENPELLD